jgi:hypothetical protein
VKLTKIAKKRFSQRRYFAAQVTVSMKAILAKDVEIIAENNGVRMII